MKKFAFKSIRSKLAFWFVIMGLAPLFIGIVITYNQQTSLIEQETFNKLVAIRDLKVEQLENWLTERIADLKTTSTDNELNNLGKIVFKESKDQSDLKTYTNIRRILNRYLKNYVVYDEIFIINPRTGIVEISTNRNSEGTDKSDDIYFTQPMQTREIFIKDIYCSKFLAKNTMAFSVPIFFSKHDQQNIIGILVACVDLKNSLYALLQNRVGLGKTGETLIVNKDVMALNELRSYENAPLRYKIEDVPAIRASQGETGIAEAVAYNDKKILAAYTYIPRTGWGFVAKQDQAELYAPVKSWLVNLIILIIGALIVILAIAFLTAGNIAAPVIKMAATAEKMRTGDFSARNHVTGSDELAALAETFNTMAESIESMAELLKTNNEITQTLADAKDLPTFGTNILKKLVRVTGSQMGAYFFLNRDTNIFEPFTSIGVTHGLLKPFDASTLEGEPGMVVVTKKITHIKDISESTIFRFRTFAGTILPKEIITIPIIFDGVVSGIVSLASIKPYPRKILDIMEQPWTTGFGTALSNMWANAETARLAVELEEANQELHAQTEELQSQSEELRQTSDELQEQNQELEVQRLQVEEASRLKSEFLSNMSHELRTPLNSVMALSNVLIMQAKDKLSEDEVNYLEIIVRNGKNLLALINDILDLSKIEAGRMDVRPKLFPISSSIETIMERLEPIAEKKGIKLNQEIPDDLPQVESDENRVHQILQNLTDNAVKFTAEGDVTVSARSDADNIYIKIADTGIGISQKDLPHIFEEFRQVDGTSARSYEGTGLGLAIAYNSVMMLGGNISVQSALGKGSTFTLTLPFRWRGLVPISEPVDLGPPPMEVESARKTILVVDDEPDVLTIIYDYLSGEGYNIITTTSGKEAVGLAQRHHPFAITLDVIMPEMDGWEVLQQLRQTPDTKDIPVIIVSVSDDKSTGIALGAVGYISKPVNRDLLIAEINKIGGPSPYSIVVTDDKEVLAGIERRKKGSRDRGREAFNRILLVEDSEAAVIQVKTVLEDAGYVVDVVRGGQEALDYMSHIIPDGIILDLMMPEVDGFQVLEKMRSDEDTAKIPVLVLTARDLTPEDLGRLSANNIRQLIQKGDVDRQDLLFKVRLMLGAEPMLQPKVHAQPDKKERLLQPAVKKKEAGKIKKIKAFPTILVVEDNLDNMITIKAVLQNKYEILEATDGEKGLKMALTERPDLILLDMTLPKMDGFTVVGKVKDDREAGRIPVIALTARAMKGDREKMIKAGCDDYIAKPIDPELILQKINEWLKR